MNLTFIDTAIEKAKLAKNALRPISVNGKKHYVMFLHPYQVTDLRINTATGQWMDIQKAAMQGGQITKNALFTGALGVWNKTILHESTRVTQGVNGGSAVTGVRRAVFCGAQAACIAFGGEDGPDTMSWAEETFDYGNQLGVAVGAVLGVKKSVYNSADFATIVVSTAAAQHSP